MPLFGLRSSCSSSFLTAHAVHEDAPKEKLLFLCSSGEEKRARTQTDSAILIMAKKTKFQISYTYNGEPDFRRWMNRNFRLLRYS